MKQSSHTSATAYAKYINPSFVKLLGTLGFGRVYERAEGVYVWDVDGKRYLDCLAGFGSVNIGHNHPELLAHLHQLLDSKVMNFCHVGPAQGAAQLAEKFAELLPAPLEISLFANGGAEAVEAALKLARIATGRKDFISCEGGFHGTSFGPLSLMGTERLRMPFEPLLEHCHQVPFGDLDALRHQLETHHPAAFLVEPIQGEAGIILPPSGYLHEAQKLCQQHGTLLILDEIQTGLGRTGSWFAFQQDDMIPDILCLAKALSGGIAPISVAITSRALFNKAYGKTDRFDLHSSTYQGNAFSCAAAYKTLEIITEENLLIASKERGSQLLQGLQKRLQGHPLIRDIRGRGLLVGIELGATGRNLLDKLAPDLVDDVSEIMFGQWLAVKLLEAGILCQPASSRWNVLRLEPPLTISAEEIAHVINTVGEVLQQYQSVIPVIADVTKRIGSQWWSGWKF
jgi:putrescine aminotransferase